jgi:hypothetical protein
MTLTAEDIRAMKNATAVCVWLKKGTARVTLTKELRPTPGRKRNDGFSEPDQRITMEREMHGPAGTTITASFVIMFARSHGNWKALTMLVRPGDRLEFYADNGHENQYVTSAIIPADALPGYGREGYSRIYVDTLGVTIYRKERQILSGLDLTFSICPQNSARAIQPDSYSLTVSA